MGVWADKVARVVPKPKEGNVSSVSKVFPDVIAGVVVVSATVAATSVAGHVVNGQDLVALYGMVMGYVFGRNVVASA